MAHIVRRSVYPSKRDAWIVLVLWVAVLGMAAAAVGIWFDEAPLGFRAGMSALLATTGGFTLWVLYSTSYTFDKDELIVRSGPFRWKVPLDSIHEAFPTRNPLSSPACSLDRIRIRYGRRWGIMISPENKSAFLRDLVSRVPELELRSDRVVRRTEG